MHRGRVSHELSDDGEVQRTVIALAPDKTDVTGEEGHEALLPMCRSADINAAAAIEHMLELDPTPRDADVSYVPLFRNTRQGGKAMTYGAIRIVVKKLLMRAGMSKEYAAAAPTAMRVSAPSQVFPPSVLRFKISSAVGLALKAHPTDHDKGPARMNSAGSIRRMWPAPSAPGTATSGNSP